MTTEDTKGMKRLHLYLNPKDWEDLQEAKEISGAYSYAQVMREALERHLTVERERIRMEQQRKEKV